MKDKTYWISNAQILRPDGLEAGGLLVRAGRIEGFTKHNPDGRPEIDAGGGYLYPSFVDIHTHGAIYVDVNLASMEELEKLARYFASQGTGHFLASILTDTEEQTLAQIRLCRDFIRRQRQGDFPGAELLGIHLEGPCLAHEYKGAMPEHLLRGGDIDLLRRYLAEADGEIRYITVAPELPGVLDCIEELRRRGVHVAIGHTGADYACCREAIYRGAEAVTHCGNAMRLIHQHEPAVLGTTMEMPIYAEMICDGRHLHPAFVRLLLASKGYRQLIAVSDSMMAAGLPDGDYRLGVNEVVVTDGDAQLKNGGGRAGSTLTMIQALRNMRYFTGLPLWKLQYLSSANAARLLQYEQRFGLLEEGLSAAFLRLDEDYSIRRHWRQGELIYVREGEKL